MVEIMKEALTGSIKSVYSIGIIVIPLMIVLQLAKDYQILGRISHTLRFITKPLGISKTAVFPLLVGIFFGIGYGAGVIIDSLKEGNLTKKDGILLMIFLSACHGIIEDTLIFVMIGASGTLVVTIRIITAVGLTCFLSKKINDSPSLFSTTVLEEDKAS